MVVSGYYKSIQNMRLSGYLTFFCADQLDVSYVAGTDTGSFRLQLPLLSRAETEKNGDCKSGVAVLA